MAPPTGGTCLVITGAPGTGKKTVAALVARRLRLPVFDLNRLARQTRSILGSDRRGDFVVDSKSLRHVLRSRLRLAPRAIVVGHLASSVLPRSAVRLAAVLRCAPEELERRLKRRRYSRQKLRDQIRVEILDVVLADSLRSFGGDRVAEFDTTSQKPRDTARLIADMYLGRRLQRCSKVKWLERVDAPRLVRLWFEI